MKYLVLLGDGMADDPQPERGGRTPLELAPTPHLDLIADRGELGLTATVPAGLEPGSDVANLSILGFDPQRYYTGRAAIEAAALGITLEPGQAAFRANLVTLGGTEPNLTMADYSGGHPSAEEQRAVVETLNRELGSGRIRFVPGVSFRNICLIGDFKGSPDLKPPHDHAGRRLSEIMPSGPGSELLADLQERARRALAGHAVNRARAAKGRPPIDGIWFWGMGKAPSLPSFRERYGLSSAVVTGVDLIRGLARLLEMEVIAVPGATGYVDTNFEGKAEAVLQTLARVDFVFLHVEAADEAGHEGDLDLKIQAIADFDARCVRPILAGLDRFPDYRVLLLPDHETPVRERGHRGRPVPFALADKAALHRPAASRGGFSEKAARERGGRIELASTLLASRLFC
jgi:2,3-bisphosphoglycerate-independent phosphoglycerate mutase